MTEMFGEAWSPMSVPDLAPDDDETCRQCSTFSHLIPMLLCVNVHGTSDKLFDSYMQEYMWKKRHKGIFFI